MLKIDPRSRTKKKLINYIGQLAKLFNAIGQFSLHPRSWIIF